MIISRTPFRLSFAGGGTDLPSYYREEQDACVLSTSLNKYMHITVNRRFDDTIRLGYSRTETCKTVDTIEHPIFKYVMKKYAPEGGLEILSMADIPSGTGLGSSSSFTVGVLNALKNYLNIKDVSAESLAAEASDIEINQLHEPIGKQDQYAAAYGGLQFIRFQPDETVSVESVRCTLAARKNLEASCQLFFTGQTRDAKTVLREQKENTGSKRETLRAMAKIAVDLRGVLEQNPSSLEKFGRLMHEAWMLKKSVASNVSNVQIDEWYDRAMKAGAWGGKILGAGSGGFLMIMCEPSKQRAVAQELKELRLFEIGFEQKGSRIIFQE